MSHETMEVKPIEEITEGGTFGILTVTKEVLPGSGRGLKAEVLCRCGRVKTFHHWQLRHGLAKSCGCRRGNPTLTPAFGEIKNLRAWSRDARCVVKYVTLVQRLSRGWEPEAALATPVVAKWNSNQYRKNWKPGRKTDQQRLEADQEYVAAVLTKREKVG